MGIIFIALGIIILRVIYKSGLRPMDEGFNIEDMLKYSWLIMNPLFRLILKIVAIILIIMGICAL